MTPFIKQETPLSPPDSHLHHRLLLSLGAEEAGLPGEGLFHPNSLLTHLWLMPES